ncbi:MAG: hypothetical protein JO225_15720 [Candidatus Eremiobacteraeota bacterium]|nr:hypothetical protein [Candidatus Eremiobacteraeota bacterium]
MALRQNEARRPQAALGTLIAHLEIGEDPADVRRPRFLLEDQVAVGGVNDLVVDLLEGGGLEEKRFGLGTPDLATASKFVADEHQYRLAIIGMADPDQGRCGGCRQATHHHGPSVEHGIVLLVERSLPGQYDRAPASPEGPSPLCVGELR